MEILILLGLLLFAAIPAFVAISKGRGFILWYIYGFFLFPFALIHAIVIKPNENAAGMKKCLSCASVIPKEATVCPFCRSNSTAEISQPNNNTNHQIQKRKSLWTTNQWSET